MAILWNNSCCIIRHGRQFSRHHGKAGRSSICMTDVLNVAQFIHYYHVIMGAVASQITSLTIVYSNVYSDADQRKHQSSASLAFVRKIHRGPVNSPHKGPVTWKMFPFDDAIMTDDAATFYKEFHCRMSRIFDVERGLLIIFYVLRTKCVLR